MYLLQVDSYSAFFDNGGFTNTELHDKLQAAGITTVYVTGLARDYCVYYTSKDAKKLSESWRTGRWRLVVVCFNL